MPARPFHDRGDSERHESIGEPADTRRERVAGPRQAHDERRRLEEQPLTRRDAVSRQRPEELGFPHRADSSTARDEACNAGRAGRDQGIKIRTRYRTDLALSSSMRVPEHWPYRLPPLLAWTSLAALLWLSAVESSPLRPPLASRLRALAIMPEGWAFFTRDPREPQIRLFARSGERWAEVAWQNAALTNGLGLTRNGRLLQFAVVELVRRVPALHWVPCTGHPAGCRGQGPPLVLPLGATPAEELLRDGEFLIYVAPPTPWAWSRSGIFMPGRVAWVRVRRP